MSTATSALASKPASPGSDSDLDDSTIPQEAWLDRDAVSFTKGCYLGQELVARIDSRGHVNRVLAVGAPGGRDRGARPRRGDRGRRQVVGQVTSAIPGLALAYVRREVEPPAAATVGGVEARVEARPGRP